MQTIYNTVKPFDKLLKKQKIKSELKYRPMYYVIEQPVDEGLLLYHTMTKAMLLLTPEEAKTYKVNPKSLTELIEQWFLVPEAHDDRQLSRQIRDVARMLEKKSDAITNYTIMTTTDCNARCFYCFEKGRPRIHMTKDTARRTADYIINHCKYEKVELTWFGGEPLFNKPIISLICSHLKKAGIEYTSSMITNGYLLDNEIVSETKELWHLNDVQITLDGTEQIYNRSKAYIYKDVNAYQHVISNIHLMQNAGIKVRIRLNIGMHNADDLLALSKELHQEFSYPDGINVYIHALFEEQAGGQVISNKENRSIVYQKMSDIRTRLTEYGLTKLTKPRNKVIVNSCQADNDHCVVITPSGHIGKCEYYSNDHLIGHINQQELDGKMISLFKEKHEIKACIKCPLYPICIILQFCHEKHCYPEEQNDIIKKLRHKILYAYQDYKNQYKDEIHN